MQTQKNVRKSFVLRKGRITIAQKRAIKSLKNRYTIPLDKKSLDVAGAFINNERKLIGDVGFGSGESLLSMANKYQEANFVGIEVYPSGIGSALNKIKQSKLSNLKLIESDVYELLETKIVKETFDAMVFLYPDPWPKKRHQKRRLLSEDFINLLHEKMTIDGLVFCKTDWKDYYYQIKQVFAIDDRWVTEDLTNLPDYLKSLPKTKYERKAKAGGRESWELFFRKVSR